MFSKALPTLALVALATAGLAQTATVPAATFDLTVTPSGGVPNTQTFGLGTAGGTPFSGALPPFSTTDVVSVGNLGLFTNEMGAGCTVTNVEVAVSLRSVPLNTSVSAQTALFTPSGLCPTFSAPVPPNLPACNPGDRLFVTPAIIPALTVDFGAFPLSAALPAGNPYELTLALTPIGAGCTTITPSTTTVIVTFNPSTSVPVELTSFSVVHEGGRDVVAWTAEGEIDLAGYEVQRSRDGRDFAAIAFVEALGTVDGARDYRQTYLAAAATEGLEPVRYYRLRSVDLDGSEQFSAVAAVGSVPDPSTSARELVRPSLLPPGQGGVITFVPPGATGVEVYDLSGRRVAVAPPVIGELVGSRLPAGPYLLRAVGTEAAVTQRIVVQ